MLHTQKELQKMCQKFLRTIVQYNNTETYTRKAKKKEQKKKNPIKMARL